MVDQEEHSASERSAPHNEDHTMQQLLDQQDFAFKENKRGDALNGTIVGIEANEILVDIGSKSEGVINIREMEGVPTEVLAELKVGDPVQAVVVAPEDRNGRVVLALSRTHTDRDWREAETLHSSQQVFEGVVAGHNKGGLIVKIGKGRGVVREGRVIRLAEFGAFIDLGGADGLAHLSELSWKRVNHPREVLKVGQIVRVQVIHIDPERKRIGLSLKRVEADPWSHLESRYQVGQLVEGTITKLAKFGAFARIQGDEEIEGLIHISELSDSHIAHPKEVVREGQLVTLRIIRIEPHERRLGLSLKRVAKGEYVEDRKSVV